MLVSELKKSFFSKEIFEMIHLPRISDRESAFEDLSMVDMGQFSRMCLG